MAVFAVRCAPFVLPIAVFSEETLQCESTTLSVPHPYTEAAAFDDDEPRFPNEAGSNRP